MAIAGNDRRYPMGKLIESLRKTGYVRPADQDSVMIKVAGIGSRGDVGLYMPALARNLQSNAP
jgi:hypothetical protein